MVCKKCGANLKDNETTCPRCGTANISENLSAVGEEVKSHGFSNKRNVLIIALAAAVIAGGSITAVALTRNSSQSVESIMTLAERYLSEQKYEQAIIEFNRVIELDPMNSDAYLKLAEAYAELGDIDSAIAALEKGLELTGDESIRAKLNELRGNSSQPDLPAATVPTAETKEPTIESQEPELDLSGLEIVRDYDITTLPFRIQEYSYEGGEERLAYESKFDEEGNLIETEYLLGGISIVKNGKLFYQQYISEDGEYSEADECNDYGDIIKETRPDLIDEYSYEYGEYGKTSVTITHTDKFDPEYNFVAINDYQYNSNGQLVKKVNRNSPESYIEYEYDDQNRPLVETRYIDGELRGREEVTYSNEGYLVTETDYFDGAERISQKYERRFDSKGRTIYLMKVKYDKNGEIANGTERFYQDGCLVKTINLRTGKVTEYTNELKYDIAGNVAEVYKYLDGELHSKIIYEGTEPELLFFAPYEFYDRTVL